jgi:GMP synthase (glutamine-hydrolysing)
MMLDAIATDTTTADEPGGAEPCAENAGKPVLLVLHQVRSNPGHIGQWFVRNGHALDIRRHFEGDPLPETLEHHCGAVIFGGPQSANDNLDYIKQETDWIGVALKERKPFLGVCLGAQMLAKHLGAGVDCCRNGCVEIGYHRVHHVYQWHREGFEMPHGADLLASSGGAFPNQAFLYGPAAVGVQFHPEIMHTQINRWTGSNPTRLLMRGARSRADHVSDHLMHGPRVHAWLDQFLTRWVGGRLVA